MLESTSVPCVTRLAVIFTMRILLLVWGVMTIMSCSTKQNTQTIDKNAEGQERPDKSVLYENEILHKFSSPFEEDTFKIYITGTSIKHGQIKFQITRKDGLVILDETFPTTM